jgi:outer membrane protein OmpA-like peptidoglycan-associated protein
MGTRSLLITWLVAGGIVVGGPTLADDDVTTGNPTADDLVEALSPKPLTRGIRPRGSAATEPVYTDLPMITFEFNSADLRPEALEVLDQLAIALQSEQLGSSHFVIEGHTDAVGADSYNQELSDRRAQAVRAYLASRDVDPARLEAIGKGETELLSPSDGAASVNRRVRVINAGEG